MKKKISELIAGYMSKHADDQEKISEFSNFIDTFFEDMDEELIDVKEAFYDELKDMTEEITDDMIHDIVDNLRRKDGIHSGMKWSKEETESVARQYDAESKLKAIGKKYCPMKFWLAMNYVYAVHYSVSRTINGYVDLAIDELANKNICFDDLIKKIFEKI